MKCFLKKNMAKVCADWNAVKVRIPIHTVYGTTMDWLQQYWCDLNCLTNQLVKVIDYYYCYFISNITEKSYFHSQVGI